jgi:PBP1b-binding outer membrane lipoprotein LpoB
MQKIIGILCSGLLLAGCASHNPPAPKPDAPNPAANKPVVTPDFRPAGKVTVVDPDGRFVIISFSPGEMPKADARLSIYHNGLKVAEVKADPQFQRDNNTVADIITGDVQAGDEARQD